MMIVPATINRTTGRPYYIRGYATNADRERAIKAFARRGLNHFVCYVDTQSRFALTAGWCAWAGTHPYVAR